MWAGPGSILIGLYIPVTQMSYALDRAVFGPGPAGPHAVNVALHVAAGIALFAFLARFLEDGAAAFLIAAVFLVHPAQVESVAWIAERKSVLSGLLIFLTLLVYLRRTDPGPRAFAFEAEWPVLLLAAAALLAKPIAVVIVPILALLDLTRPAAGGEAAPRLGAKSVIAVILSKAPYIALAAAAAGATLLGHSIQGGLPEEGRDAARTFATMLSVVPRYLRIALFPTSLTAFHTPPEQDTWLSPAALAGLWTLILLGGVLAWRARRSRVTLFFTVWAAAAFLPVSNVIRLDVYMAERYLYLPLVALAAPPAFLLARSFRRGGAAGVCALACGALIIACFGSLTFARARVWHDSRTLWTDTLAKSPRAGKAHNNLGLVMLAEGDVAGAERHFREAVRLQGAADTWLNLGIALSHLNRPLEALEAFDRAKQERADLPDVDFWRGRMFSALGKPRDAQAAYYAELARRPDFVPAWIDLAGVLARLNRLEEALAASERAARIAPDNPEALLNVGILRWRVRRDATGARAALNRSLEIAPNQPRAVFLRQLISQLP
jgi:tetratricopeptide (TPR) repeat protein